MRCANGSNRCPLMLELSAVDPDRLVELWLLELFPPDMAKPRDMENLLCVSPYSTAKTKARQRAGT
jgi:hypothetical protein